MFNKKAVISNITKLQNTGLGKKKKANQKQNQFKFASIVNKIKYQRKFLTVRIVRWDQASLGRC